MQQALKSVSEQTYHVDNIIVIDDASTDNSFDIVEKWSKQKEKEHSITLLRNKERQGPSYTRNLGIQAAWTYTDVFALLDSDDYYWPKKVEKSVEYFKKHSEIGMVYSDYETLSVTTGQIQRQYKEPFSRQRLLKECLPNNDSLITKKAFEMAGLYDVEQRVAEDLDLWFRISEKLIIVHIPECLITIRVGRHSATDSVAKERWERDYRRVFEKARMRGTI